MSILQKLSDNKIGIGIVAINLVVLGWFFGGFLTDSKGEKFALAEFLFVIILICDLPAIAAAALLWIPVLLLSENGTSIFYGFIFTCFITTTFQWLFVGRALYNTFSPKAAKPISLALNDE